MHGSRVEEFVSWPWQYSGAWRHGSIVGHIVVFKMGSLLCDEAGLHVCWSSEGAGGNKPCFRCANVVARRAGELSIVSADRTNTLVDITCLEPASFHVHSDDDVLANAARLQGQRAAPNFASLEQAMGLNWNEHGLLFDPALAHWLKPISWSWYDPMHVFSRMVSAKRSWNC